MVMTDSLTVILAAQSAEELFGEPDKKVEASAAYRKFARQSHPDMFVSSVDKARAAQAFIRLTELWELYNNGSEMSRPTANLIKTRSHEYSLGFKLSSGDMFDRFEATYNNGADFAEIIVTRSANDNDLAKINSSVITQLTKSVSPEYAMYYPKLIENFIWTQNNIAHEVSAMERIKGFYSLSQVKLRYPDGVDAKDFAWIFRRMLVAIGVAHDNGFVHGAATPENFMIHPEMHGMILRDWQYAITCRNGAETSPLVAFPVEFKDWYPSKAMSGLPVGPALDIRMAALTAETLLRADAPPQFASFLRGCQLSSVPPASQLLAEFDDLILRMWGNRKFHVFTMNP
jgi:hypothetical protein